MSPYLLAAFLLLYSVGILFHPSIPEWVIGLVAGASAVAILSDKFRAK